MRLPNLASVLMTWCALLHGAAHGQTIDLDPVNLYGYEDGSGEVAWKINNPSLSGDWFNVDFGADASGATMVGLWVDFHHTGVGVPPVQQLGFAPSAASGAPDLSSATLQNAAVDPNDGFNSPTGYATPCQDPGSDFHVVLQQPAGDNEVWVVSDTDGPLQGRSFFSTDSFATQNGAGQNWRMGYVGWDFPLDGTLLVNGGTSATVSAAGEDLCLTFTACQSGVGSLLYLCSPIFFGPLIPGVFTTTGGVLGGPCDEQWTLCTTTNCEEPVNVPLGFCSLYLDPCDLKPNGTPRSKLSTTATLLFTPGIDCYLCYGQRDDGIVESVWQIQNPAGSGDWFNVNHGPVPPIGVTSLTGVQVSSWDFCGTGPCWAEVGIYADVGGSPDINGTKVTAGNPCMAPAAADLGPYPMTVYDIPDTTVSSGSVWHVAARYSLGDSCVWIGTDTDGTDSACGVPIPSAGSTSGFTHQSYSTGVAGMTAANWCMKLDWN